MIVAGREFDDGSLCWDDLYAFIFASPPNTAVFHTLERGWTTTDYLLAHVVDGLRVNNWQRTEDATRRPPRNVPEPFPRPSDRDKKPAAVGDTVHIGTSAATVTTVTEFMERRTALEQRWREKRQHKEGGGS